MLGQNTESNDSSDDSKSLTEYDWALDYINEFIDSPLWHDPVQSHIDENCIEFDREEEMTNVQNEIYRRFNRLIEGLIERYIHSIGLSTQQFLNSFTGGEKKRLTKQTLEFILCYDDSIAFKKMMRSRNMELNVQALRMIQQGLTPRISTNSLTKASTTLDHRPPKNPTDSYETQVYSKCPPHCRNEGNAEAEMLEHEMKDLLRQDENAGNAEVEMLEQAIKNVLQQDEEEEDLEQAKEFGIHTKKDGTRISVHKTPRLARAESKHLVARKILKQNRFQSLPLTEHTNLSTDSGPDEWSQSRTHSSSFSSNSLHTSVRANKSNRKTPRTFSSSGTKLNDNSPTEDT